MNYVRAYACAHMHVHCNVKSRDLFYLFVLAVNIYGLVGEYFIKKKFPNIMGLSYVHEPPYIMGLSYVLSIMGLSYVQRFPNIMGLSYV